jgi:glycine cleavage system H protein
MEVKENLSYTNDHEWIKIEGNIASVGITDFAQSELGDIVFIEVETIGENLNKNEVFGTVEAVKTVSDLFLPVSGKVLEFNNALEDNPELVNDSPYDDGWIVKIEISNIDEISDLLDSEAYKSLIGQ